MDVHRPGFVEQRKLLEQAENSLNANRDDRELVKITTSDLEFLLPGFSCSPIPCLSCTDYELTAHCPMLMKHSISYKWTTGWLQIECSLFFRGQAKRAMKRNNS